MSREHIIQIPAARRQLNNLCLIIGAKLIGDAISGLSG
jgi:hypothetical protein